ncbi:hypothetical protein VTK73DRAFT_1323 [Phialemonium thermophilum]|uniref:Secreted protein n=1 Tax=Phialemonium thermophilum TaxID=223376 RepID=A0ABR3VTM0_9PEZI
MRRDILLLLGCVMQGSTGHTGFSCMAEPREPEPQSVRFIVLTHPAAFWYPRVGSTRLPPFAGRGTCVPFSTFPPYLLGSYRGVSGPSLEEVHPLRSRPAGRENEKWGKGWGIGQRSCSLKPSPERSWLDDGRLLILGCLEPGAQVLQGTASHAVRTELTLQASIGELRLSSRYHLSR